MLETLSYFLRTDPLDMVRNRRVNSQRNRCFRHPLTLSTWVLRLDGRLCNSTSWTSMASAKAPSSFPYTNRVLTITAAGVAFLMKYDRTSFRTSLQHQSPIVSKANGPVRCSCSLRLCRFCTSCISRRLGGLPLSLSEVSTVAHAICTMLTYAMWLFKTSERRRADTD